MKAIISEQDVFDACSRIRAQGQEPTTLNVYDALGKKGSYSTIGRHITQWQAANPPQPVARNTPATPEALVQAAKQFVDAVWESAATTAADEYKVEKDALKQERDHWKNQHDEVYKRLMELDEQHNQLADEHEAALQDIERLKATNLKLQADLDASQNTDERFRAIEEKLSKLDAQEQAR